MEKLLRPLAPALGDADVPVLYLAFDDNPRSCLTRNLACATSPHDPCQSEAYTASANSRIHARKEQSAVDPARLAARPTRALRFAARAFAAVLSALR